MPKVFTEKPAPVLADNSILCFFSTEGYKFPEKRPELRKVLDF